MTEIHKQFSYPTEAFGRIPSFNNIGEEAEFWDTHDITEFVGVELHVVEDPRRAHKPDDGAFHDQGQPDCPDEPSS